MLNYSKRVKIGSRMDCKYPLRGNRNILKNQTGVIEKHTRNWILIKRDNGTFATLRRTRIVDPKITK